MPDMPAAHHWYKGRCDCVRFGWASQWLATEGRAGEVPPDVPCALEQVAFENHVAAADFEREAAAHKAVHQHANILSCLAAHCDKRGEHGSLVLELCSGASLAQAIPAGGIPEWLAVRQVEQLVRAVEHVHAKGYVHRAVGVENMLLHGQGQDVKLCAFAAALRIQQAAARREGQLEDWSYVGLAVWQMLTGCAPPEDCKSPSAALSRVAAMPAECASACTALSQLCRRGPSALALSEPAIALIDGLLAREPWARLSSADAILQWPFFYTARELEPPFFGADLQPPLSGTASMGQAPMDAPAALSQPAALAAHAAQLEFDVRRAWAAPLPGQGMQLPLGDGTQLAPPLSPGVQGVAQPCQGVLSFPAQPQPSPPHQAGPVSSRLSRGAR
jgi:hypothetical protein